MNEPEVPAQTSAQPRADPRTARVSYSSAQLSEADVGQHWLELLQRWYADASVHPWIAEPNAIALATVDEHGDPDVRTVLARGFDAAGITFFTNYGSVKGIQLEACPRAAVLFSWLPLERQIRFRGAVSRVTRAETEAYFASRPRGSQVGAWASPQSSVIDSRADLEHRLATAQARLGDGFIPAPPQWGGYRLAVEIVEFWQGREFRLHDRLRYVATPSSGWSIERLAP